jgi:hypothetical protein
LFQHVLTLFQSESVSKADFYQELQQVVVQVQEVVEEVEEVVAEEEAFNIKI